MDIEAQGDTIQLPADNKASTYRVAAADFVIFARMLRVAVADETRVRTRHTRIERIAAEDKTTMGACSQCGEAVGTLVLVEHSGFGILLYCEDCVNTLVETTQAYIEDNINMLLGQTI